MLHNLQDTQTSLQIPTTGLLVLGKLLMPGSRTHSADAQRVDCLQKTAPEARPALLTLS